MKGSTALAVRLHRLDINFCGATEALEAAVNKLC
jgi:hypothetical protein